METNTNPTPPEKKFQCECFTAVQIGTCNEDCDRIKSNPTQKCNGNCGMNYCDENGCIERKRVLVDPVEPSNSNKWTYEDNGVHIDVCYKRKYMFTVNDEKAARTIVTRFNRLEELEAKCDSDHLSINELLSEFKRQGIETFNWDGDEGAETAIVDGVVNHIAQLQAEKENETKNGNFAKPMLGAFNSDPTEKGYYLTKTEKNKWGIAYWDGNKFWDDPSQDGKLALGIRRDFIIEWYLLPSLLPLTTGLSNVHSVNHSNQ